jgi:hypothetical protein
MLEIEVSSCAPPARRRSPWSVSHDRTFDEETAWQCRAMGRREAWARVREAPEPASATRRDAPPATMAKTPPGRAARARHGPARIGRARRDAAARNARGGGAAGAAHRAVPVRDPAAQRRPRAQRQAAARRDGR